MFSDHEFEAADEEGEEHPAFYRQESQGADMAVWARRAFWRTLIQPPTQGRTISRIQSVHHSFV